MRPRLQQEDTPFSRSLSSDLLRIDQYADMVMTFLRLDSESTDYVLKEYALDPIICQAVRKYAPAFIMRKLTLDYKPVDASVVTDEKWLLFVIEQLLSNALKYTLSGSVSIYLEAPRTLFIADTGIGIAPEDLPRIFERGYTGINGRDDKKASGIGLYNILGMGKHSIALIVIWESMMVFAVSQICGLAFGIAFSKLAELGLTQMVHGTLYYTVTVCRRHT